MRLKKEKTNNNRITEYDRLIGGRLLNDGKWYSIEELILMYMRLDYDKTRIN